jgi:hypothetical protein
MAWGRDNRHGARRSVKSVVAAILFAAASAAAVPPAEAPDHFVQRFYDLYTPMSASGWARAIRSQALWDFLDPALARALKADADAQAASPNDIVGLDFDPFLSAQDPWHKYEAGKATRAGAGYTVRVHGVAKGKRRAAPSLVVDVAPRDGHWVITDFHYPDGDDLRGDLRQTAKDRAKPVRHIRRSELLDDTN